MHISDIIHEPALDVFSKICVAKKTHKPLDQTTITTDELNQIKVAMFKAMQQSTTEIANQRFAFSNMTETLKTK